MVSLPAKPTAYSLGCSIPAWILESPQLVERPHAVVSLTVVLYAERDDAGRIVVLALAPLRIEVMPCEVWAVAPFDRAAETDFLPEEATDSFRRSSIQCGFSVGVGVGVKAPFDGRIRIQEVERETGFVVPVTNARVEFSYRLG